jgi:L-ribulose-5-phosphate 3-epimerase
MSSSRSGPVDSRRKFLEQLTYLGIGLPMAPSLMKIKPNSIRKPNSEARIESICVFSKALQFLNWKEACNLAAETGFDGIDYTVRPEGHVLPEKVESDLPAAINAAKSAGINTHIITTAIAAPNDPYADKILSTASKLGVRYYRMNWLEYDRSKSIVNNLDKFMTQFKNLAALNKKYGITGDYQNHTGAHFGSPVWDLFHVVESLDPDWTGSQYDIRHATCEGANCWTLGLELIHPYIHTLVIKDFYWRKVDGQWVDFNCPVGEGMTDFTGFFSMIKKFGVTATITMHFEYPLTDQPDSMLPTVDNIKQVKTKMKKDLDTLKNLISAADIAYH